MADIVIQERKTCVIALELKEKDSDRKIGVRFENMSFVKLTEQGKCGSKVRTRATKTSYKSHNHPVQAHRVCLSGRLVTRI